MAQTLDVTRFIDGHKPGGFAIRLLAITFLLVLADGFDIAAVAFALPGMLHQFQVRDVSLAGPVLSASLVGILIGALLFGWLGDRMGRKRALIFSCALFGVVTWATAYAGSLTEAAVLRLIAGIGIGGLLPNVGALVAELAPRRWRATMMIITFSGVAFGGAFPGLVAATLVPSYGWQIIFIIGGVFPLIVAFASIWLLPESVKFLVVKGRDPQMVARVLRQIDPATPIEPGTRFMVPDERDLGRFRLSQLFADGLAPMTLLLWVMFALNLMGYFFLLSWTPTVLSAAHLSPSNAAVAGILTQIGGLCGGLCVSRPMDRWGLGAVAVLFGLAIPVVGSIGLAAATGSAVGVFALQFLAGFCVLGGQTAINVVSGIIYPTAIRSNGSGWAFGVGRIGSIVGPVVGGILIAGHLPIETLYMIAALPYAVVLMAALAMMGMYRRRVIGEAPAPTGGLVH
jgi:AAHS family 4-hydroxybenzoate transporter-like MFS transporter